jgi:DNA repair/transcription protein MET18/MMS19
VFQSGEQLRLCVSSALESASLLLANNGSPSIALRGLTVWLWVCKALVIRSHDLAKPMINKLISLFSSQLAETAADGFYIILADSPDVMSDTSVCNKRVSCNTVLLYLINIIS